jgi:hypothetical protein
MRTVVCVEISQAGRSSPARFKKERYETANHNRSAEGDGSKRVGTNKLRGYAILKGLRSGIVD